MAEETTGTPQSTERSTRVTRTGVVTSDKRDKTITLVFDWSMPHSKYGKNVKRSTKLHAHDENNEAQIGDRVEVIECRPYSKQKHWRLQRIVERAKLGANV